MYFSCLIGRWMMSIPSEITGMPTASGGNASKLQLAIVVPCYNEEEVLLETSARLLERLDAMRDAGLIAESSEVYFVDDGSKDGTWEIIQSLAAGNPRVHGIKLSCNRGHQ